MVKKLKSFVKKVIVPVAFVISFSTVAYAAPTDLQDVQNRTLSAVQFIEGIGTVLVLAFFGIKAKYNWSMSNIVENVGDIEKYKKGFQKNITGIVGLLCLGAVLIYVTQLYKA
jgi:hypothetical protein